MQRILILGPCGSGKSTFAIKLNEILKIPLFHLDQLYFGLSWSEPEDDDWNKKVLDLSLQDSWIIDGNYTRTLKLRLNYADTVIYLHSPMYKNLYRVLKRIIKYHGEVRPDMASGCKERVDLEFLSYVAHFNFVVQPRINRLLEAYSNQIDIIRLDSLKSREIFLYELSQGQVSN